MVLAPAAKRRLRPLALACAAIVVTILATYFVQTMRRSPAVALTERDTVLVADFVNTTNEPVFDDALKQAVTVQLQQTPFLALLADQRIQRTLRLMQRPAEERVTGQVAREACLRAGATATVEGSIAAIGSSYVITLGVHNCQSGESLAKAQSQTSKKEDVLTELGSVVTEVREHLGESLASIQKYDVPVTDATTSSLDALRAYGQAVRARATKGDEASIPLFKQVIGAKVEGLVIEPIVAILSNSSTPLPYHSLTGNGGD